MNLIRMANHGHLVRLDGDSNQIQSCEKSDVKAGNGHLFTRILSKTGDCLSAIFG